ncbi:MAG: cation transporter [Aquificota bacterium]|nr:MAG: cation transporter [Aquificota bacterium]
MVCKREHVFYLPSKSAEKRVLFVFSLTLFTMVVEVVGGYIFRSVALLADGVHMASHTFAFGIAYMAYYLARKWSKDPSFTFGTWKVEVLGGYTSALLLLFLSFLILYEAFVKLFKHQPPDYEPALAVALLGLGVNVLSAFVLGHEDHDHNLKSAYFHVLSDAFTSFLAIGALLAGKYLDLWFFDPISGFVGFAVVAYWAFGLLRESAYALLDRELHGSLAEEIIKHIESDGLSRVYDIHLIKVSKEGYACIIGIETSSYFSLEHYEGVLKSFNQILHATIELRQCVNNFTIL